MAEELNNSLEFTPTWIVAVVCFIIGLASLLAERGLHRLPKYLQQKKQNALFQALQKLKAELMLLGFISLLLTVSQNLIRQICIPPELATHILPCKRPSESSKGSELYTIINRRHLAEGSNSEHCTRKQGKVPLLSLESLYHLHIFIFVLAVLAVVHVVLCVITMGLGGAKIRRWKQWEDKITATSRDQHHHHEFFKQHTDGYWRRAPFVGWMIAFFKQFIKEHCPNNPRFNFHKYMMRTLEVDFKKAVAISWYLWLFIVLFVLLNLQGWHTYFWSAFLPLILLLLVGAKLEYIKARLAQESGQKPSDEHFWFNRPTLVLDLIHFILFQNSFEIAFFFWIWSTYGFDSCILDNIAYIITRLVMA